MEMIQQLIKKDINEQNEYYQKLGKNPRPICNNNNKLCSCPSTKIEALNDPFGRKRRMLWFDVQIAVKSKTVRAVVRF